MNRSLTVRFPTTVVLSFWLCCGFAAGSERSPEVATPPCSEAEAPDAEELVLGVNWTIERIEKTGDLPLGAPYRVINHFGDIRLRAADSEQLLVIGAAQYSPVDKVRPVLDIRESDSGVVVEVRFPNPENGEPDLLPSQVDRRRVDLAVMIPGPSPVDVESLDGMVEAKGLAGSLGVQSLSGAVRIVARNDLDLHCMHGDVEIYFKDTADFPVLAVETLTGDIRIEFPAGIHRTVRAETNGQLVSDFSMTVEKKTGSPHKVAMVPLGAGGDIIPITSNLGTIFILDQPLLTKPGSQ